MCRCVVEFGCGRSHVHQQLHTPSYVHSVGKHPPAHTHTHTHTYTKINNKNNKQSDEHTRGPAIRSRRCSELGIETGEATTPTRGHRSYGTCTAHARAHPYVCTQFSVACARKRYIYIYIYTRHRHPRKKVYPESVAASKGIRSEADERVCL